MRIIRDTLYLDPSDRGAAAAIGNFDGVHLGHRAVIDAALDAATQLGAPRGLMTFEPHPREFFAPDAPPFRLMNAEARANELAKQGVEKLYEVPFNAALVALSPRDFAQTVIHHRLGLAHVVIGADFCFGKGRAGNATDLQRYGAEMGFGVTIAPMFALQSGRVSSTAIRTALTDGNPREAAAMLGHWHRIVGEVIRGDQRGRELGYPTANMSIAGLHPPKFGVYAVRIDIAAGPHQGRYDGAASIGVRPMFDGDAPNCETFIFDFKGDLYGQHISVALVDYLRPELKFDGLPALIDQMDADCTKAREILSHV